MSRKCHNFQPKIPFYDNKYLIVAPNGEAVSGDNSGQDGERRGR